MMFSIQLPIGSGYEAAEERSLKGGSLKAAFLGKHKQAELNLQVVNLLFPCQAFLSFLG